jgi:hypothetical protein
MSDETTNESNEAGKETTADVPKPETTSKSTDDGLSPLDRAEAANKEKAALLEREEKMLERREKIVAAESVGGRARMTQEQEKAEETPEEKAKRFESGGMDLLA